MGRSILLAEDDVIAQTVLSRMLASDGHTVTIAANGAAALDAVRHRAFDMLILDSRMPGLSGPEVARAVRALPGPAARLPIVAISAGVSDADRRAFLDSDVERILGKPVAAAELRRAVTEALAPDRPAESPNRTGDAPADTPERPPPRP